jgi:hypothetical protein
VACPDCGADVGVPLELTPGRPAGRPESGRLVVRVEVWPIVHTCRGRHRA